MLALTLPPIPSWRAFLAAATAPPTIDEPDSRRTDTDWPGATWDEAVRLGTDGWPGALREAGTGIAELRAAAGLRHARTTLAPVWDPTGAEADTDGSPAGAPEYLVDAAPPRISLRGTVITFLVPAGYAEAVGRAAVLNRALALATLCTAIVDAGHGVEVWSGDAGTLDVGEDEQRYCGVAKVIAAGEPFDVGRLVFAAAHPAMLRRLWFGVWDAQPGDVAAAMWRGDYGHAPFGCRATDLPAESTGVTEPYVLPYLAGGEDGWADLPTALAWARRTFAELGL